MNFGDLEPEQRDALIFMGRDLTGDKKAITIIDPEEYAPLVGQQGGNVTEETRRESYGAAKQDAAARRRVILEILTERGGMTAREVAAELHRRGITPSIERNFAAPRLTELKEAGKTEASGKKICDYTGRCVTIWTIRGPREAPQGLCGERTSDGVNELSGLPVSEEYEVREDEKEVSTA